MPYRFEAMWITHPRYEKIINNAWNNEVFGSHSFGLIQKLKIVKNALKSGINTPLEILVLGRIIWNKSLRIEKKIRSELEILVEQE